MRPVEQLRIDTPEQIALELQVAGIGSRFLAIAVDTVLQAGLYVGGFVLLAFLRVPFVLPGSVLGVTGPALAILFGFCIYWGYFALFEILWSGRTPGKRMAGIRVIKESGRPINAFEAIARNVVRAIDFLPAMYAVGVVAMMLNRRSRRLGDFVAGTIVVHDRQTEGMPAAWSAARSPRAAAPPIGDKLRNMSPQELQLIETYLHRRFDLAAEVRDEMAEKIVQRISEKTRLRPATGQPIDEFLETVAQQLRDEVRFR